MASVVFGLYALSATYLAVRPQKTTSIRDVGVSIGSALVVLVVVGAVAGPGSAWLKSAMADPPKPVDWHGGPDPSLPWKEQVVRSLYAPGTQGDIDRLQARGDCLSLATIWDTYSNLMRQDGDGRHNYLLSYIEAARAGAGCGPR